MCFVGRDVPSRDVAANGSTRGRQRHWVRALPGAPHHDQIQDRQHQEHTSLLARETLTMMIGLL